MRLPMTDEKSATIEQISNGYTVELYTPRKNKDDFGRHETVYAKDLEEAYKVITKYFT